MDYIKIYANFLKKYLKSKKKMRVVFDCSNGVTALVIKRLSELAIENLEIILINGKIDGNFPAHGPNPMHQGATDDLRTAVKKHKADLGVIFDGDGDRVFFMDNGGREIIPDIVMALISRNYKGPTVVDLRMGYLARELMAADGKKVIDSRVGHYFMKKIMAEKRIKFGGELSGHYYFYFSLAKEGYYADSGIFAAIEFINAVSALGADVTDWIDSLPRYYRSGEVNFSVKNKERTMKLIDERYKKSALKTSYLDGITLSFPDFWFNVRPSNTEDLLRLNMEAKSQKVFNREFAKIQKLLKVE